ncbi:uncharacterized protein G2W53_003940 [Senna tora]|uniref:Uncharacterized protein n=1 Tax=Senna tora TaxID=362788 RepID=A0A834XBZ6_9FABA|nr:uncharacterized protein G2W53_003940 [Senna tora]
MARKIGFEIGKVRGHRDIPRV